MMDGSPPHELSPHTPALGSGRYALVEELGRGGSAAVFRAWDHRLRVWRALKVMLPELLEDHHLRERFLAEAATMAPLEHPNLVRIYDIGEDDTFLFLVMELVDGGTLEAWIRAYGAMAPRLATRAVWQVATALKVVHAAQVIHRDIKPQNVLISTTGQCKLSDFGIAQQPNAALTLPGTAMGTQGYMAPEQRRDAMAVDQRADIYGLGATLWSMLRGEPAFDVFAHLGQPNAFHGIPSELHPVLAQCCAYQPERRFGSAAELERALRLALDRLPRDPPDAVPITQLSSDGQLLPTEPLVFEPTTMPIVPPIPQTSLSDADPFAELTSRITMHRPQGQTGPLPYFMPSQHPRQGLPSYIETPPGPGASPYRPMVIGVPDARGGEPSQGGAPRVRPEELPGPHDNDESAVAALFELIYVPLGIAGLGAAAFALALMVLLAVGNFRLQSAETVADESRDALYTALEAGDRGLVDWLAAEVGDAELSDAYANYLQTRTEPERLWAALDFVERASQYRRDPRWQMSPLRTTRTELLLRTMEDARVRYENDVTVWRERATELTGQMVIGAGAQGPPPEPQRFNRRAP